MDQFNFFKKEFPSQKNLNLVKNQLVVLLGSFGDFDSFEYAQALSKSYRLLAQKNINLFVIGIGNRESKQIFSKYTGLPGEVVQNVDTNVLHLQLGLETGHNFKIGAISNMLLMCAGVNSSGTLKEVVRGYVGDRNAPCLFEENKEICFNRFLSFKSSIFDLAGSRDSLRPFELATLRLSNMIQVISNWNTYVPRIEFITQRGGTYLFNERQELCYCYKPKSLLGYSETMNKPLSYLNNFN